MNCPVCGASDHIAVLSLTDLPILANARMTPSEGAAAAKGDIELVVCVSCAHLFNQAFDPDALVYDGGYENSLHFSPTFRAHAESVADRLVTDFDLRGRRVAEIGCGPGHLLAMLVKRGVAEALGFDPSYDPERLDAPADDRVRITTDLFPGPAPAEVDLVLGQHVLEHLEDPVGLLRLAALAIDGRGAVHMEVPNGATMLGQTAVWDLIYEHVSYFVPLSLQVAAERSGLAPIRMQSSFGDQFLSVDAVPHPSEPEALPQPTAAMLEAAVSDAVAFGVTASAAIEQARTRLTEATADGPVALWGAGSKGTTYLNLIDVDRSVAAVVDINPRKLGTGVPGTGQVIVSPADLVGVAPATVFVANPVYVDEIAASLHELGLHPTIEALW